MMPLFCSAPRGLIGLRKSCGLSGIALTVLINWIATSRYDLTAEEVAEVYKLRWSIESFFGWWKQHLTMYHLIARTQYGLMVQLMSGLIPICCLRCTATKSTSKQSVSNESGSCASQSKETAQLNQHTTSKKQRQRFGQFASAKTNRTQISKKLGTAHWIEKGVSVNFTVHHGKQKNSLDPSYYSWLQFCITRHLQTANSMRTPNNPSDAAHRCENNQGGLI